MRALFPLRQRNERWAPGKLLASSVSRAVWNPGVVHGLGTTSSMATSGMELTSGGGGGGGGGSSLGPHPPSSSHWGSACDWLSRCSALGELSIAQPARAMDARAKNRTCFLIAVLLCGSGWPPTTGTRRPFHASCPGPPPRIPPERAGSPRIESRQRRAARGHARAPPTARRQRVTDRLVN